MNCKPGDLAVVVRSAAGNEGKIVRCIRLLGDRLWYGPDGTSCTDATWEIDTPLAGFKGFVSRRIGDSLLRPLRDGDGTDETLLIAGLPQEVTA